MLVLFVELVVKRLLILVKLLFKNQHLTFQGGGFSLLLRKGGIIQLRFEGRGHNASHVWYRRCFSCAGLFAVTNGQNPGGGGGAHNDDTNQDGQLLTLGDFINIQAHWAFTPSSEKMTHANPSPPE